jgi:ABC-type transport system substrate-binding protein
MQLFYGPNAAPGANTANYANEEFDRLYQTGAPMPPSPIRTALYQQMNRLVVEDCVTISGIARTLILLWDKNVRMLPDRSFVGGFFFRFAAVTDPASARGEAR